ncbi:MAG: TldD/PmbA family protein [Candidatus Heimdallarchaeota archaeon]|nr:TldD/PmbA family protein [Candidatus Heimdallarchaeota archaeon]MBY8995209.1 TldD/PmbA family protein [Candidatus Heimdallarchaeota archaeon]
MTDINLIEIAEQVVKNAQALGADHSEVVLLKGDQLSINLEESSVVKANSRSNTGIGLRVFVNKAVGLGSSTQFDKAILESMTSDAVSLAKASNPDPDNAGLAQPTDKYPKIAGLYDKELACLESSKLVELAIRALDAGLEVDSTFNISGSINLTVGKKVIVNSNGINVSSDNTFMQIYLSNKITKDDDVGVGFEYQFGRSLDEFTPEDIGKTAADKALKMLGGQKIETGQYPFLLDQRATRSTLSGIVGQGVSAYNIIQGTAFFSDKLGEEIANPAITVVDNPLEKGGYGSRFFDDEGSPCQKTTIVDKGTLLSYLSDVYTAKKLDIPNTGNASKQGYEGIPHPRMSLVQIEPGTASKDELFAELGTGLYLESALMARGGTNISQQVDVGYWVENGEIKYPVKNTMLGTTVYEVMKNINLVGKDLLVEGGMKSPMILIGPTKFSGGK